jgi:PAS domain S-box-containing protein
MRHDAASPIGRSNGSGSRSARHTSVLADPGWLAALRQRKLLDTPAEEDFDRLVRQAAHLLEVPIALVSLLDQDRQVLKASVGLPQPWASGRQTPLPSLRCQQLLVTRQSLVIPDTRRDPRTRDDEFLLAHGVAAYLSVPLIVAGRVLGSLCVADRQPRHWTAEQVATLTELVGPLLIQLQQRVDLAARGELQRRLADVEARQQALLERVPGMVYTLGPEPPHEVLSISPQIEVLLGEPAVDWIGESDLWKRLVHPDDVEWVMAEYERTKQTEQPFVAEYRMRTRDGQVRWVRDEAVLVHGGDGRPLCWQGIISDLTATRLMAARLAEAVDREQQAAQQLAAALEREQGTAQQLAAALGREQATAAHLRGVDEMKARLAGLAEALEREQDTAQELAAALDRERAAAEHLRAVDEMKTTFLEAVSHDLRSPLTTVLGIALTLERGGGAGGLPADEAADLLGRLSANARRLDGLLGDLLDLDRLARGTLTPADSRSTSAGWFAAWSRMPTCSRSMRWWWTPGRCRSRSTPPRSSGSWRTWWSMRPSTRRRAPPSGSGFNPSAMGCCWWSRTRVRACRPSFGSWSSSRSARAAMSPITHPARASGWRWSPSSPACTGAAPGCRTALVAALPFESSSLTPHAWTRPAPKPSTTGTFR